MRSIWKGAISFGLVNIPIRLYSATEEKGLNLDMLHDKDQSPIRYARICISHNQEVPYKEIVKGYKVNDSYVILEKDDFLKADVRKTKTIDVIDFAFEKEIDSIYFEKPYYLEPEENSQKAYVLLRDALQKSKKVGIAKYVIRNRERLATIKALGHLIVLNQIRYQSEIRNPMSLKIPNFSTEQSQEMDLALALIDKISHPFRPELYKDTYIEKLMTLISEKKKGIKPQPHGSAPKPTEVDDLMDKLKESLSNKNQIANSRQ